VIDSVKMRCGYRAGVPVQQPYTKYEPDNDEVYIHAHSHSTTHTHTHTHQFNGPVRNYPGEPVPER